MCYHSAGAVEGPEFFSDEIECIVKRVKCNSAQADLAAPSQFEQVFLGVVRPDLPFQANSNSYIYCKINLLL